MNHKDLKQNILEKIKSGNIEMHSSGYFAFRVALFALFAFLALLVSILIFNFIFFSIRLSHQSALLGFGPRGLLSFIHVFPWPLLIMDIVFIVVAGQMLRYFRFGYKNPVLVLIGGLLLLTVLLGLAMDRATPFNRQMLTHARNHELGLFNGMYEHAHRPGPPEGGFCRCVILAIGTSSVIAYNLDASTTPLRLELPRDFATSSLRKGEIIFVAGDRDKDTIRAFGVRELPDDLEDR